MKRILFILCFIFVVLEGHSQIITNINIQGIDCNNTTGYAVVSTDIPAAWFIFKQYDDVTMSYVTIQTGTEDSVGLSSCGNVSVEVLNSSFVTSDDSTFFVSCPIKSVFREHDNPLCFGDSTGRLSQIISGGVPFISPTGIEYYNYSWYQNGILYDSGVSGVNDTIQQDNLITGQYYVQITDSTGCVFQDTNSQGVIGPLVISSPSQLMIDSLVINSIHCKGTNTGSVVVNIKNGKRFESGNYYNFYLTNTSSDTIRTIDRNGMSSNIVSDTTPYYVLFDSLGVGNYTIHVVDSFGCTFDSTIYVMEPDNYNLFVSIDSTISFVCEQDSTWLKIDSISGGHPNLYYYWEGTSPTTDSMYVPAGTYTTSIVDLTYGCKDSLYYTLTAPNIIEVYVTSTKAKCFGESSGSLQIDSIYGGTPPYIVQWGGIDTNNLFAGQYTLFITDALGCIYMEDHEVFENPDVNLNETTYTPDCYGGTDGSIAINLTGGTSPYFSYNWSSNATGGPDSIYSLSADTYVLQTTDALGCIFSDTVVMSEPDNLVVNFGGYTNPLSCNGGQTLINAIIIGGTLPYSYNWSTFDTMSQIVASAGNYNILVTDDNGCPATNQILITEPELLEIVNTSFIEATCNVGATASVVVSGGTPPILYIWSNGETDSIASDLTQGTQWVLVTDSCGDTATYSFEVESYILETIINYDSLYNSAVVTVSPNSDGPPYSYQWYDYNMNLIPGETDTIIEDLCPSWYYCITTDANNCEVTDSVLADLYFPMGGIIDESTTTVYEDALLWGSEPYTYLWDNGNITAKGNICPGFHRVWVTDVNGCEVIGELNVEEILLTLSPSDIIIECDITNLDILLEITATGGTGDYTYLWSNGQTENPINLSLNPGVYSVEVTDENFCNEDTVFHIAAMSSDCIPNVFSPNNDGSNDVWNLEDAFFYLDSEVRVYSRYGKLVFKSVGYNTPWDGKNQSGNNVEDGAYFYVINLGNNIEKIKGTVTIIR